MGSCFSRPSGNHPLGETYLFKPYFFIPNEYRPQAYVVQEGNVYRVLPVKNPRTDRDYLVNTEKSYDLMMNKFSYRGLDDSTVYYSNDYAIQVLNHRSNLNSLAEALIDKGEQRSK